MPDANTLLDLLEPRTILLSDRSRQFTLKCRRITDADWTAYFAGITVTSEQEGKSRINVVDVNSPRLALAERVLIDAQGYKVHGGGDLTSLNEWQTKIPLAHRARLGETLADVRVSPSDEYGFMIFPEAEVVSLDATWSAFEFQQEDSSTGLMMRRFQGLEHFLMTPTEEQHRRYTRESSRSRIIGGSRTAKTIYQGAQLLLAKLYDELIVSVQGYAIDGQPLTTDKAAIVREMDMLHKVMAAQELFQPSDTVSLSTAESDQE